MQMDKMQPIISWNVTHLATSPRLDFLSLKSVRYIPKMPNKNKLPYDTILSLPYCKKDLSLAMCKNIVKYHNIHPAGSVLPCICCNFGGWLKEGVRSRRSIPFGLEIWDAAEALGATFSTFCRCRGSLVPDLGLVAVMRFSKLHIPCFLCQPHEPHQKQPKPHFLRKSLPVPHSRQGAKWLPLQLL